MSTWKENWTNGDTVYAADMNRIEGNGKELEQNLNNSKTFFAIYGSTTAAQIEAAYQSGKQIICKQTMSGTTLLVPLNKRNSATSFLFLGGNMSTGHLCSENGWSAYNVSYKPSTHASSHASDGTDPIKPEDIGAVSSQEFNDYIDSGSLMTSQEREKLSGIEEGANKYVHPSYTAKTSGLYKVTVDSTGHISGTTEVTKSDITGLGIPSTDTTYGNATTSAAGLMSSSDKTKLNGIAAGANKTTVVDNLTSTSTTNALSANQGNVLSKKAGHKTEGESTQIYSGTTLTTVICGHHAEIFNDYATRTYDKDKSPNQGNVASGIYSHSEGFATTASGSNSHAEGYSTLASGNSAHSEGNRATASGTSSHAEGGGTTASGISSHAEGTVTTASGESSHAGGNGAIASGNASFSHGYQCQATTAVSVAFGERTKANGYQFVCGQMNAEKNSVGVGAQGENDSIFIIGNGVSDTSRSNAFRVTASGKCYNNGGSMSSGADFAEYFEWLDGNPNNEDRRGRFVTLDGEKIRFATSDDADYILGVVSSVAAVIGNVAGDDWKGKYLTDVFGSRIYQDVEIPESVDEETGEIIPAHTIKQWILNPDYNPEEEYISREFRKEWSPVGMLGQIVVVDDGTCQINSYCAPSEDGIATASKSGYRVMKRIDDNHIKILVK